MGVNAMGETLGGARRVGDGMGTIFLLVVLSLMLSFL